MNVPLAGPSLAFVVTMAFGIAQAAPAVARDAIVPPTLEATIPLDGVRDRIDHMAVDRPRGRLIVAELGNGTVDILDIGSANASIASRISQSRRA